jgi:signal recognition particle subunit SEC65
MEYKQFSVIYPSYMDAKKTVKKGRRISVEEAVPNPTVVDIGQALQVRAEVCNGPHH